MVYKKGPVSRREGTAAEHASRCQGGVMVLKYVVALCFINECAKVMLFIRVATI